MVRDNPNLSKISLAFHSDIPNSFILASMLILFNKLSYRKEEAMTKTKRSTAKRKSSAKGKTAKRSTAKRGKTAKRKTAKKATAKKTTAKKRGKRRAKKASK